jgi:hypothetical protein
MNALIQGSAARHTKLWMRACWREGIVPLLQMHDCLDLSVASPEQAERVAQLGREAVALMVPIQVDLKFGRSWGDAKHSWAELHGNGAAKPTIADLDETESVDLVEDDTVGSCSGNPTSIAEDLIEVHAEPAGDPPPFSFTLEDLQAAIRQPRNETPKGNGHDSSGNGHDRAYAGDSAGPTGTGHGERDTGTKVAFYVYRHADGTPYLGVKRTSTKQFPQYHWTGIAWAKGAPTGPKIPYRLPELIKAPIDDWILVCAGEKDAESAAALGFVATTNPEGERKGAWVSELNAWFAGRQRAALMEDNDKTGQAHALEVAAALRGIVTDIRIIRFRELSAHADLTDWLALGYGAADLLARIEAAPREDSAALQSIRASDVQMRSIEWLWHGRFAIGKLGLLCGLPDEGKSTLLSYIAARITGPDRFSFPENEGVAPRGTVIMLTGEDDAADTLVPRLKAAGADLERVEIVNMVKDHNKDGRPCERMFSLVDDLPLLRRKIVELGDVRAIEIDPVSAYLGRAGAVDAFRDSDVRAVLTPLVCLAAEMRIAIIAIMHFNKKQDVTNAMLRISNSLAFAGVARHVFSITDDAENDRKLMARAKNNIAAKGDSQTLAFRFETREVGQDPKTDAAIEAPAVVFQPGYVDVTATEALSAVNENKSPGAKDSAKEWLRAFLTAGPMPATEVEEAAKAEIISKRTLHRAKSDLGVRTFKKDKQWFWGLPNTGGAAE